MPINMCVFFFREKSLWSVSSTMLHGPIWTANDIFCCRGWFHRRSYNYGRIIVHGTRFYSSDDLLLEWGLVLVWQ